MAEMRYAAGETVFHQGEPATIALRLITGRVEVVREMEGERVVLGHAGPGEFVGEMGVLEGRPRSATVIATDAVVAEPLEREAFLRRIAQDHDIAFHVLLGLSERLRRADDRIARGDGTAPPASPPEDAPFEAPQAESLPTTAPSEVTLRLFAADGHFERLVPKDGLVIAELPFVVGRMPAGDETAPRMPVHLALPDMRPYRLSRVHFTIERSEGDLVLRDLGSMLGTEVDGQMLSADVARIRIRLGPGEHEIRAGGVHTPFVFRLVVG